MAIYSLWIINKAGGLVYQREFADGLAKLTSNEYLVLAGTLHGIHAITRTKFVLLTSLAEFGSPALLARVYEAYADAVMKNPFHTPEMPIRSVGFDTRVAALIGGGRQVTT